MLFVKSFRKTIPIIAGLFLITNSIFAQKISLQNALTKVDGIVFIKELKSELPGQQSYAIYFEQPVDHKNPNDAKFNQLLILNHVDYSKPMVLVTEGYSAGKNTNTEVTDLLGANQLIVEHRYFGNSVPDSLDWAYLTLEQSANDHHRIVSSFKNLYQQQWVTTGISKGGQAALYHRYFFPDDVDASVPYVAPINQSLEDPRIYEFLKSAGDQDCRDKIFQIQRAWLSRRNELLPLIKWYSKGKKNNYDIGLEAAFEYAVLEFPFTFWQWGHDCSKIPAKDASTDELMEYLVDVVGFYLYSNQGVEYFRPHFYQAVTEAGYYGFETTGLEDVLQVVKKPTNVIFAPQDAKLDFNPVLTQKILNWLTKKGDNIIYIYGELDTWTATGVTPGNKTNALRIDLANRSHGDARIKNMNPNQKKELTDRLEKWLKIPIRQAN